MRSEPHWKSLFASGYRRLNLPKPSGHSPVFALLSLLPFPPLPAELPSALTKTTPLCLVIDGVPQENDLQTQQTLRDAKGAAGSTGREIFLQFQITAGQEG